MKYDLGWLHQSYLSYLYSDEYRDALASAFRVPPEEIILHTNALIDTEGGFMEHLGTITLSINNIPDNLVIASPWVKVVDSIDSTAANTGAQLGGQFMPRTSYQEASDSIHVSFAIPKAYKYTAGMPVVVGFKYGEGREKGDAVCRFAMLGQFEPFGARFVSFDILSVSRGSVNTRVEISGAVIPGLFRYSGEIRVIETGIINLVGMKTSNAFFGVAQSIVVDKKKYDKAIKAWEKVKPDISQIQGGIKADMVQVSDIPPIRLTNSPVYQDGKRLSFPPAFEPCINHNGIWLVGFVTDGRRQIVMLDALADFVKELDPLFVEFMRDQGKKLEAMAMTYRIIASAIEGNEILDSDTESEDSDDDEEE